MIDKNISKAPSSVQTHYSYEWVQRYYNDVSKKWPLSENQEDICYGYIGPVIDRLTGHDCDITDWGNFNYEVKVERDGMSVWCHPCLFVIEK